MKKSNAPLKLYQRKQQLVPQKTGPYRAPSMENKRYGAKNMETQKI